MPPGTVLETAGIGGVFPPGIRVGRVLEEAESRSGWSHSYLVEPAVRPGSVAAVTVWTRATGRYGGLESDPRDDDAGSDGTGGTADDEGTDGGR